LVTQKNDSDEGGPVIQKILLRAASVAMLVHDAVHTYRILLWRETDDPDQQEVIGLMTTQRFPFVGVMRSMGDRFEGFFLADSLALLFFAVVFWLISNDPKSSLARNILIAMFALLTPWWIVELIYLFPGAALMTLVAWLLSGVVLLRMKPTATQ
jgi:hypothetical protein